MLYSHGMALAAAFTRLRGLAPLVGWRRLLFTLCASTLLGLLLSLPSVSPTSIVVARAAFVGLIAMLVFGILERWPARLPRWLGRWVLQLVAVVVSVPFAAGIAYEVTTEPDPLPADREQLMYGYLMLTFTGILFAPWIALGAMVRQRESLARSQALAFAVERSELERQAADARLRLLQAQVAPHFLFNTLANVQALVDAGSPQASRVLESLVAYLRAAVPRLHDPQTTLGQELLLVQAYLEVMQMRMPDRLQFAIQADEGTEGLQCPPMTVLTLVENAIRHGIDPSEDGGRIHIHTWLQRGKCYVSVRDTGLGLQPSGKGLGTGLSALRERLRLTFGGDAHLRLTEASPHGVCAELEFPARQETA